ncbi:TlpA family protein disulfide reductase [Kroppenstedtia sanguinis]|uniref:TlpA family protein disulfide reductase n=1 Tax=Kroppenstedtia sanguinis TaxID=1380684 RepID=A0ABW4C817_9BACL
MPSVKAPDFCLPDLDDNRICLKDLRGKVILLSFWVTWCPSCQADLPQKEIFARSLDSSRFSFFTVNVTGREADPQQVKPFIQERGYRFPVLLDEGRSTYDAYGLTSVPSSVLIDREGNLAGRFGEETSFIEVVNTIGHLLDP